MSEFISELILHGSLIILFGYCLYLGFKINKKMYGGKFSSILPQLVGAVALLFLMQLINLVFGVIPSLTAIHQTESFVTGVQILQITTMFLFVQAVYSLYKIGFATSGIFGGKE